MFPLETRLDRNKRRAIFENGLASLFQANSDALNMFCLQELNPLDRRSADIKKVTGGELRTMEVNVGVRIGRISYPIFLQEGLCNVWNKDVADLQVYRWTLSGPAREFSRWGWPITLQTRERRGALGLEFTYQGLRMLVVNVHLHHGPPTEGADLRRIEEIKTLLQLAQEASARVDAFFLVGDFNMEQGQQDYKFLQAEGFRELSTTPTGGDLISWNPKINPICERSAHMGETLWDQEPRQFDHIFVRGKAQVTATAPTSFLFAGQNDLDFCSDHFGLLCPIEVKV